jgi:hypothetical protein
MEQVENRCFARLNMTSPFFTWLIWRIPRIVISLWPWNICAMTKDLSMGISNINMTCWAIAERWCFRTRLYNVNKKQFPEPHTDTHKENKPKWKEIH